MNNTNNNTGKRSQESNDDGNFFEASNFSWHFLGIICTLWMEISCAKYRTFYHYRFLSFRQIQNESLFVLATSRKSRPKVLIIKVNWNATIKLRFGLFVCAKSDGARFFPLTSQCDGCPSFKDKNHDYL